MSADTNVLLQRALYDQVRVARSLIDEIEADEVAMDGLDNPDLRPLRVSVELMRALSSAVMRMTPDQIHVVFGAPGDWGYHTPIGDALARVYGVFRAPESDGAA